MPFRRQRKIDVSLRKITPVHGTAIAMDIKLKLSASEVSVAMDINPEAAFVLVEKCWRQVDDASYRRAQARVAEAAEVEAIGARILALTLSGGDLGDMDDETPDLDVERLIQDAAINSATEFAESMTLRTPKEINIAVRDYSKLLRSSKLDKAGKSNVKKQLKSTLRRKLGKESEPSTLVAFSTVFHRTWVSCPPVVKLRSTVETFGGVKICIVGKPDAVDEAAVVEVKNPNSEFPVGRCAVETFPLWETPWVQLHAYLQTHRTAEGYLVEHFREPQPNKELIVFIRTSSGVVELPTYYPKDSADQGVLFVTRTTRDESNAYWGKIVRPLLRRFAWIVEMVVRDSETQLAFVRDPAGTYTKLGKSFDVARCKRFDVER